MSLRRYFRRSRWDAERAAEIEAYLATETDDNLARGMPPSEARCAALRKIGNVTHIREEIYRMNSVGFLETVARHQIRHALVCVETGVHGGEAREAADQKARADQKHHRERHFGNHQ